MQIIYKSTFNKSSTDENIWILTKLDDVWDTLKCEMLWAHFDFERWYYISFQQRVESLQSDGWNKPQCEQRLRRHFAEEERHGAPDNLIK